MKEAGAALGLPVSVYGPETHITAVVPMALSYIEASFSYSGSALQVSSGLSATVRLCSRTYVLALSWSLNFFERPMCGERTPRSPFTAAFENSAALTSG